MRSHLYPWQLLSVIAAGYLNTEQRRAIEYLKAENLIFRKQLGKKRLRLTDDQRRRLAVLGKVLGRRKLTEICPIVTTDTLFRWHRRLIAKKYDSSGKRKLGRPKVKQEIRRIVVLMASENRSWGYKRIEGELRKLGRCAAKTTIANILQEHGREPAPEWTKRTTWTEFLSTHWDSIAATDFFTVEAWTPKGLTRFDVLGMEKPKILIRDGDGKFGVQFNDVLRESGCKPKRIPRGIPVMNAFAERFVRSIKTECLDHFVCFSEDHLDHLIEEYSSTSTTSGHTRESGTARSNPGIHRPKKVKSC